MPLTIRVNAMEHKKPNNSSFSGLYRISYAYNNCGSDNDFHSCLTS